MKGRKQDRGEREVEGNKRERGEGEVGLKQEIGIFSDKKEDREETGPGMGLWRDGHEKGAENRDETMEKSWDCGVMGRKKQGKERRWNNTKEEGIERRRERRKETKKRKRKKGWDYRVRGKKKR